MSVYELRFSKQIPRVTARDRCVAINLEGCQPVLNCIRSTGVKVDK